MIVESYFECFVLVFVSFVKIVIQFYVPNVEQITTSYKGEKVISYTVSFKKSQFRLLL